jgi:diguanylate cyclase (GGDEF)-like protein
VVERLPDMTAMGPDPRLDRLVETVIALASGDLAARLEPSEAGDEIDAVTVGINMLAEELQVTHEDLERRVQERTVALEKATDDLQRLVLHDPLTDLPNRRLLKDRIEHALAQRQRRGSGVALLFVDLDRFKTVNDSLGHNAGDQLLVHVARQLRGCVRPGDTVARLGGDEFVMLCEEVPDLPSVMALAQRVLDALSEPFRVAGQDETVTASIGIALALDDETTGTALLSQADTAMYAAKKLGRAQAAVFQPHMSSHVAERHQLETELRHGITHGQVKVHYQPVVEISTGRVTELEALVRWVHPERGLLLPAAFLELAEESGLIVPLGRLVLRQACLDTARMRRENANPDLSVAVNLSALELMQEDLISTVVAALDAAALPASALCLELTETGLINATEDTLARLNQLKRLGVKLAIDDFGTGYSSLTYLKRFPVDIIKTDRSFVTDMCTNTDDAAIVAAVIGLGHALGLRSVAEGVETPAQLEMLKQLGCDLGQGYHFSRPVTIDVIGTMLQGAVTPLAVA